MSNKLKVISVGPLCAVLTTTNIYAAESTFSIDNELEIGLIAEHSSTTGETDFIDSGDSEITVTGESTKGRAFVRGVWQLVLSLQEEDVGTGDIYFQFGTSDWDFQVGRFEAVDLFPLGEDVYIAWATNGAEYYQADRLRGQASDGAQLAFHYKISETLVFELATSWGDTFEGAENDEILGGARPVLVYTGKGFGFAAGLEYLTANEAGSAPGELQQFGAALSVNFDTGLGYFNLNTAYLDQENSFEGGSDKQVASFGANLTADAIGIGVLHAIEDNGGVSEPTTTAFYLSYTLPLLDIDNASVIFALSHAFSQHTGGEDDEVTGAITSFEYTF